RTVPFSARHLVPDGIGIENSKIVWRDRDILSTADVPLPGAAGLEDSVAAAGAGLEYGVEAGAVTRAIKSFRPLAHRLEVIAESGGVTFIDDSKATNPHATLAAVQGLDDVVLIAGGRSKGIDLGSLRQTVPPVRAVVAIGEARDELVGIFENAVPVAQAASMEEAVRLAIQSATPGGSVLLSPGCASLDMYESYAARGEHFASVVRTMIETISRKGSDGD
ncbi:MAG: hypothetical protein M3238_04510, partial [Actinomycetota bacterium]|nr:hypothetical protein [Actinomycetota bacterium]